MNKLLVLAAILLASAPLGAQEFYPIDSRSKGMGNTGVALIEGAGASYLNPANLALGSKSAFEFMSGGFGTSGEFFLDIGVEGGTLALVDQIADLYSDLNFQQDQTDLNTPGGVDNVPLQEAMRIFNLISQLNEDGHGMFANAGGGVDLRMGNFGLFARELGYFAADPYGDLSIAGAAALSNLSMVDFFGQITDAGPVSGPGMSLATQLDPVFSSLNSDGGANTDAEEFAAQAETTFGAALADPAVQQSVVLAAQLTVANAGGSSGNTLFSTTSGVEIRGLLIREYGVAVGIPLGLPGMKLLPSLRVGVALKAVEGQTFVKRIPMSQFEDTKEILRELKDQISDNSEKSTKFNMDIGAAISPIPWLNIGLTAKNILPMEFDFDGSTIKDAYEIDPQFKIGAAFSALGLLKVTADADLLKLDRSEIEGLESQIVGIGAELSLPIVKIRAGTFLDIASEERDPVYTLGLGLSLAGLVLDINGQLATHKVKIEEESPINGSDEVEIPSRLNLSASIGFGLKF